MSKPRSAGKRGEASSGRNRVVMARRVLAILGLLVIGGLIGSIAVRPQAGGPVPGLTIGTGPAAAALLLVPVAIGVLGLVANLSWSRWLGIALALTVIPWAGVVTVSSAASMQVIGGAVALGCAVLVLLTLAGRSMIAHFEGRMKGSNWTGPGMRLLRATVIGNLVSVLTLFLFIVAYQFRIAGHLLLLGATMVGLVGGILLLARQKTAGLLLVWLCSVLFLPAGFLFIRAEAADAAEATLLAAAFLPGLGTGWATVFAFGKPIWKYLKS